MFKNGINQYYHFSIFDLDVLETFTYWGNMIVTLTFMMFYECIRFHCLNCSNVDFNTLLMKWNFCRTTEPNLMYQSELKGNINLQYYVLWLVDVFDIETACGYSQSYNPCLENLPFNVPSLSPLGFYVTIRYREFTL